jgi:hypothetical protein
MQQEIERDLKTALLAGEKETVETLKGIKSALQYEAVAKRQSVEELDDQQIENVLAREAKKRQEAQQLYETAGEQERAAKEGREKGIIQHYLPARLSEAEVAEIVSQEFAKLESPTQADMGRLIGAVKARTGNSAEGALIAKLVKDAFGAGLSQ